MRNVVDRPITAEARIRAKNQLTLPEVIVQALDAQPDDVLVFEVNPGEPGTARAHLVRHAFAGSMRGVYGTTQEVLRYVREERAAWGE